VERAPRLLDATHATTPAAKIELSHTRWDVGSKKYLLLYV
jgi:hypothetical protein